MNDCSVSNRHTYEISDASGLSIRYQGTIDLSTKGPGDHSANNNSDAKIVFAAMSDAYATAKKAETAQRDAYRPVYINAPRTTEANFDED